MVIPVGGGAAHPERSRRVERGVAHHRQSAAAILTHPTHIRLSFRCPARNLGMGPIPQSYEVGDVDTDGATTREPDTNPARGLDLWKYAITAPNSSTPITIIVDTRNPSK